MKPKIFILCLLVFTSCLDEISFQTDDSNDGNLVIQAKLSKGNPSIIEVQISKISTLQDGEVASPIVVNVERVQLTNDLGQTLELTQLTETGVYFEEIFDDSALFSVEAEQSYQLQILTEQGEEIVSTFEPMLS